MNFKYWLTIACVTVISTPPVSKAQTINEAASGFLRSGNPQEISPRARPSDGPGYTGYYVGGGAVSYRRGDGPSLGEGTWGWDYQGRFLERRVNLLWWHGRRTQGGVGAYKTDGPKLPFLP